MKVNFLSKQNQHFRYYYQLADLPVAGTPLVLVHGAGASADTWVRNIDQLAVGRNVFAPDLLGHGFSANVEHKGRSPQQVQVEHLTQMIDHWGLDTFDLMGSSFGALLTALIALVRPDAVRKLVLVGSGSTLHPGKDQERILRAVLNNQLPALDEPTLETIRSRNIGSNFDKTDEFSEIQLLQLSSLSFPGRRKFFIETIEGLIAYAEDRRWRVYERLEKLNLPVLIVSGENDPRADHLQVQESARRIPDSTVVILPRCGHKPFSEHPEQFNAIVRSFLDHET